MSSEVELVNRAYAQIGQSVVLTTLSDSSAVAQNGKIAYERARDYILNTHSWTFSRRRVAPALLASNISQYSFAYALPYDYNQIIALFGLYDSADFQSNTNYNKIRVEQQSELLINDYTIELYSENSQAIFTNAEDVVLYYTAKVTDPNLFNECLKEAIVFGTAENLLGVTVGGSQAIQQATLFRRERDYQVSKALSVDMMQDRRSQNTWSPAYQARFMP